MKKAVAFMNLPVANILIDLAALILLLIIIAGVVYRVKRGSFHHFFHWDILKRASDDSKHDASKNGEHLAGGVLKSIATVLFLDVLTTRVLRTCNRTKWFSHLAIFWGFAFLGISTTLAFITNPQNLILPLDNPVKLFGNAGGILVLFGFVAMFYVRYREGVPVWSLNRSDYFLMVLFLAVVTGFLTQQAIYSVAGPTLVSSTFWIHMIFVLLLLATAPFTKFIHAVQKPVMLLYEEIDKRREAESLLPSPSLSREPDSTK